MRLHLLQRLIRDAPGRFGLGEEWFRPTQDRPLGRRMCIAAEHGSGRFLIHCALGLGRNVAPVTVSTPRTNSSLKSRLPARISFMYDGEKLIMRAILAPPAGDPASTFRLARHTRYSVSSKSSMG